MLLEQEGKLWRLHHIHCTGLACNFPKARHACVFHAVTARQCVFRTFARFVKVEKSFGQNLPYTYCSACCAYNVQSNGCSSTVLQYTAVRFMRPLSLMKNDPESLSDD